MKTLLVLACGASLAWCADNAGIMGPVSGYVVEGRSRAIRPINGIPGAARLGAPLDLPFAIRAAAISADRDYALAIPATGDNRPALLRGLRSGAPVAASIENVIAASAVELADSGAVAVVYSDAQVQFVAGLPDSPSADAAIDVSAINGVAAVAVDTAGGRALLLGRDGSVFHVARGGDLQLLTRIPGAVSATFLPATDDAVVASAETGAVTLLHGVTGSLSVRTAAGVANGLDSARSVRATAANEFAVVDAQGRLGVVAVDTGDVEWIGLAGSAERIDNLGAGLFVLNQPGSQPLLLLDIRHGKAPYFVPPDVRNDQRGELHHRK